MSQQAIYVTYTYYEDMFKIMIRFLDERARDIIPTHVIERLKEIEGYKISTSSKLQEFNIEMEKCMRTLSEDKKSKVESELSDRTEKYFEEMRRELVKTGIVKIEVENFVVSATGNIPGMPLNQFSLDEHNNYLRIATTVGMSGKTENDVYVLDRDLKIVGSVKGLGMEERIYSVRFIGDRGYIVTFRETDPFYVLDLSDPKNPQVKGELKIPGYSSYLHPIEEHLILGVGKEGWKVKISLFDVSSATEPK
jgi:inhibitor of cysteine peptidase